MIGATLGILSAGGPSGPLFPHPYYVTDSMTESGLYVPNQSGTTISMTYPSGIQADDIALLFTLVTSSTRTWNNPAGYSVGHQTGSQAMRYRRMVGTESGTTLNATVTSAFSSTVRGVGIIIILRNLYAGGTPFTPWNNADQDGATSSSPSEDGFTTVWDNSTVFDFLRIQNNASLSANPQAGTERCFEHVYDGGGGDNEDYSIAFFQTPVPTAGATGAIDLGEYGSSQSWIVFGTTGLPPDYTP